MGTRGYNSLDPEDDRASGNWYNLKTFGSGDSNMLGKYVFSDNPNTKPYILAESLKAAGNRPCWVIEMWHSLYDQDLTIYKAVKNEYVK